MSTQNRIGPRANLRGEMLEDRTMLSAGAVLHFGVLTVTCTAAPDQIKAAVPATIGAAPLVPPKASYASLRRGAG